MPDKHRASKLPDLLISTAREKHTAVLARSGPLRHGMEPPRQVYMAALDRIAQALAPHGFRYTKSGPRLTRTDGPAIYRIIFQSDRNNVAGEHVRFLIHAAVENADLKRWLAQSAWPFASHGLVAAGQIGNLRWPQQWWSWEISDPSTRAERVDDAIAQIEAIILPLFDRLADPAKFAERAMGEEIPGLWDEHAVRLCYWQHGPAGAERCIAFWRDRAGARRDFRAERDRVLAGGAISDVMGGGFDRLGTIAGALRICPNL